jgi:SAM-dependent MidA family methyltransferase
VQSTPLKTHLLDIIRSNGPITFEHYMAQCLYHPEFGYYTRGLERTGVGGDYFTSSDLHPIFARLMARQADEMWRAMECPTPFTFVEMGAGRGIFAADFLAWSARELPDLFAAFDYVAIEPGAEQRGHIEGRISSAGAVGKARLLANLEGLAPSSGCFFSNELVDAFPVHVMTRVEGRLREIYVAAEEGELREQVGPISDPAVAAYVARYANQLDEGHRVEVNLHAPSWLQSVTEKLIRGFVVTIDYGDMANRLYTSDRPRGTLLAYHHHTSNEDFFAAPGETDLTAHVNFTALIDTAKPLGLEFAGFTTQEKFLLALGEANQFADLYDPGQTETGKSNARLKLKRLVFPEGMGNIFRVLVQQRGVPTTKLTGLKFASPVSSDKSG